MTDTMDSNRATLYDDVGATGTCTRLRRMTAGTGRGIRRTSLGGRGGRHVVTRRREKCHGRLVKGTAANTSDVLLRQRRSLIDDAEGSMSGAGRRLLEGIGVRLAIALQWGG